MRIKPQNALERTAHQKARRILMNYSRERDKTRTLMLAWLDGYNTRRKATPHQLERFEPATPKRRTTAPKK